jgi:hypothetical protein
MSKPAFLAPISVPRPAFFSPRPYVDGPSTPIYDSMESDDDSMESPYYVPGSFIPPKTVYSQEGPYYVPTTPIKSMESPDDSTPLE